MPVTRQHIALLASALEGGVGRKFTTLAKSLSERGYRVDVLLNSAEPAYLAEMPAAARILALPASSSFKTRLALLRLPADTWKALPLRLLKKPPLIARSLLPALERYLRQEQPDVLLSAVDNVNIIALWARWLAGADTRVVVQNVATFSSQVIKNSTHIFDCLLPYLIQHWYPQADSVTAVSNGAADDLAHTACIPRKCIATVYNPVDLDRIVQLATAVPDEPWLLPDQPPVLLAVGRLAVEKDFPTLLRTFAQVRQKRELRLIILGEGEQRAMLAALCGALAITQDVRMPGFINNPYAYMARAAVLVLSSAWEGFPNVLLEALACGCPVVSTNCPGGANELLAGGVYGRLTPVGNDSALAQAILETLAAPRDPAKSLQRARMFSLDTVIDQYLRILLRRDTITDLQNTRS